MEGEKERSWKGRCWRSTAAEQFCMTQAMLAEPALLVRGTHTKEESRLEGCYLERQWKDSRLVCVTD